MTGSVCQSRPVLEESHGERVCTMVVAVRVAAGTQRSGAHTCSSSPGQVLDNGLHAPPDPGLRLQRNNPPPVSYVIHMGGRYTNVPSWVMSFCAAAFDATHVRYGATDESISPILPLANICVLRTMAPLRRTGDTQHDGSI